MNKLINKLLGLNVLIEEMNILKNEVLVLTDENKELKKSLEEITEKVDEIEEFDADDFVREDDINDRVESYLNDNEYVTSSYVDDEIESKVSDKVEEAVEELDIEDKVTEVVDGMDKASFGDTEELKAIVIKVLKTLKFKVE
jgi:hypothetical protein